MIIVLILCGVTALFGALSLAYLYSRVDRSMHSVKIPVLFLFNTFVLIFSSFAIQRCRKYFDARHEVLCARWGLITLSATTLFLILQGIAWYQLFQNNILPASSGGHGFLYAISILHFLHVMAGIPFLARIIIPLVVAKREGNASLFFLDDDQRRRLRHTAWYWHFIDIVWVYLVVFFLVNSFI